MIYLTSIIVALGDGSFLRGARDQAIDDAMAPVDQPLPDLPEIDLSAHDSYVATAYWWLNRVHWAGHGRPKIFCYRMWENWAVEAELMLCLKHGILAGIDLDEHALLDRPINTDELRRIGGEQ